MSSAGETSVTEKGLALALSGGGARGIAHVGVLAALNEAGLKPVILSGTSMGAVVASLYAAGVEPKRMLELVSEKGFLDMFSVRPARTKLFEMKYLKKILDEYLPDDFSELKTPLYVCATNLSAGKPVYFSTGNPKKAVKASAAVPILFSPVAIDGDTYVDGGVLDNLPAKPLVEQGFGDYLVGVEVNHGTFAQDFGGMTAIATEVFHLMIAQNSEIGLKLCKETIVPDMSGYSMFDFTTAAETYRLGYESAKAWLSESRLIEDLFAAKISRSG